MDKQTSELRKMDTTRKALVNKNDALAMQMTNLETEISNVKGRVEMRLKKVEELRRNIAIRQEKLDASESKHDVDHRIKELDKEISCALNEGTMRLTHTESSPRLCAM